MTVANPFALVPQGVSFNAVDAGASAAGGNASGAAGASGTSSGAGAGGSATGTQGGTGNGGSVSPVSLADDTPVTIGGKTYGSFKDYRSEVEGGARTLTQAEIKQNLATLARQLQQTNQFGKGQQQPQQQRQDPFAGIRDMAFVDGKTLESLYQQGLGPIAQAINQLQQYVAKQDQTIKQLRGGVAPIAERHNTQEFQNRINSGITAALQGVDAKDPFVSELAQDVFHSYEWAKGKEDQEFAKYLGERYAAAEKHFKAKFKAELDAAKNRKWQRPGGNATPSGAATNPLARATPKDIARNVFAGSAPNT